MRNTSFFHAWTIMSSVVIPGEVAVVDAQTDCDTDARDRWPWRLLSCQQQDDFMVALKRLKDDGVYDDFVRTHEMMHANSHGVAEFLPWHRWFIYQFESALRSVADDPCITLPYWDWELDSGSEFESSVFEEETFGFFTQSSDEGGCMWPNNRGACLRRSMDGQFGFRSIRQVLGTVTNYEQYSDDFDSDPDRNNGFRAALEGGAHAMPHNFLGGSMITRTSPDDPLFYLHHANVDRIWALWQDWTGHDEMDRDEYFAPDHYEGEGIDSPLMFPSMQEVGWDFSLNGDDYPTPREVMKNDDIIQVRYREDQMVRLLRLLQNETNPAWFEAASSNDIEVVCDPGERRQLNDRELDGNDNMQGTMEGVTSQLNKSLRGRSNGMLIYFKHEHDQQQKEEIDLPITSYSFSADDNSPDTIHMTNLNSCLGMNEFSRKGDRDAWDRLCEELPLTASFEERLAAMAVDECREKGNPYGATRQWIENMKMTNELVAFECFHLPDHKDD